MINRVQEIFEQAVTVAIEDRRAFLDGACGSDAACRAEVESLLIAHDEAAGFLDSPAGGLPVTIAQPLSEAAGSVIGRYKLLERIGEGGFGVVYMADQLQPVQRRVALKIIKLGMDTKQVIARFEAERQALALMDHANIARVLDAGATATGRPYFVMELVKGVPITEYCDTNSLTTRQRLDLFVAVCGAVQHAHQKGIIHRDLKPSNVLVTLHDGEPVPKVIDFGIAKAISRKLTEKTLFTEFRQLIGTPEFMSPEQAEMSGLDIDTRSDIYSLGVLLYQLLTGTTPFDPKTLRKAGYAEIQRIIREEEPHKPSTRVGTMGDEVTDIAKHRHTDAASLNRQLRGDLDWIVMKSLEKDRTRRYETAKEFAIDVRRHLDNQPVIAGPPGSTYRLAKFLRRNRVAVTVSVLFAAVIVTALALTATGFIQARKGFAEAVKQRDTAETARRAEADQRALADEAQEAEARLRGVAEAEAARARSVTEFLTGMLRMADPEVSLSPDVTVRSMLDSASAEVGGSFREQPAAEARVRTTIGQAYASLGEPELAEPHLRRALELREQLPETTPAQMYGTLRTLSGVLFATGDADLMILGPRGVQAGLVVIAETRPDLSTTLGRLFKSILSGKSDVVTDQLLARSLELTAEVPPGDPVRVIVADTLHTNGLVLWDYLDNPGAEPYFREAVRLNREELPAGHPQVAYSLCGLVSVLNGTGRFAEAELLSREAIDILKRVHPEGHWYVALTESQLGESLVGQGRFAEAESLVLPRHERIMAARNQTATTYASLSRIVDLYDRWGRPEQAAVHRAELARTLATLKLVPSWTVVRSAFGPEHAELAAALDRLQALTTRANMPSADTAELNAQLGEILADFLPRLRSQLSPDHPLSAFIAKQFREWAARWDGWADAELRREMLRESLVILRQWQEQLPADTGVTLMILAQDANDHGDHVAGERMGRESWALMKRAYGKETWFAAMPALQVGRSLLAQQRYAQAELFLVDSYAIFVGQSGEDAGETRSARRAIIDLYVAWDRPEHARPYVQMGIERARRAAEAPGANANDQNYVAYVVLSAPLPDLRNAAVALPFAKRAVQMSEGRNATYLHNLARCHFFLGDLDLALDLQRRAVSLLPTADENDRSIIRQRLAEYENAAEGKDR